MAIALSVLSGAMFLVWRAARGIPGLLFWAFGNGAGAVGLVLLFPKN